MIRNPVFLLEIEENKPDSGLNFLSPRERVEEKVSPE